MNWWQYLMLVNIYLLLFYGFYVLLLSRETFFQLNRIYLVAAALLSFFIPLIHSDWVKNLFITQQVQYTIYSGSPVFFYSFKPIQATPITVGQILVIIYLAGIFFLLARFAWQLLALKRVIDQPQSAAPYSFFKKIELGENTDCRDVIAAHEGVHASQWHSADVLIIEAVMIINWFNPVVYLYRFAIKHIHEFIADSQAIKAGTNKADYAMLLLSQTFNAPAHQLVNPFFNKSLLKQRIMMMQKNRSQRTALIKYGLSAPLFILMLILSSATVNSSKPVRFFNKKAEQVFLTPAALNSGEIGNNKGRLIDENPLIKTITGPANIKLAVSRMLNDTMPAKDDKIFNSVEQVPEFPGGQHAFIAFLAKNIRYPAEARKNNAQGKVIINFIVEKDGELTNIHAVRSVGYGTDEEAVRVLKLSPKWDPGVQNGKLVRVAYSVPISFTIESGDKTTLTGATAADTIPAKDDKVFTSVEKVPEFPGGVNAFMKFLAENIKYPADARENHVQGRVIISFIVETDGTLSNIRVLRGIGHGADEEALRVIRLSPKWNPGIQNGKLVRVAYTVPISFSLGNSQPVKPNENKSGAVNEDKTKVILYTGLTPENQRTADVLQLQKMPATPLYLLDGKEIDNLNNVNPNDIESISVIKDKAATALYGTKGANGVVFITTKNNKHKPPAPGMKF